MRKLLPRTFPRILASSINEGRCCLTLSTDTNGHLIFLIPYIGLLWGWQSVTSNFMISLLSGLMGFFLPVTLSINTTRMSLLYVQHANQQLKLTNTCFNARATNLGGLLSYLPWIVSCFELRLLNAWLNLFPLLYTATSTIICTTTD